MNETYIQITHGRTADDTMTGTLIRHQRDAGRATRTACNLIAPIDAHESHHYVKVSVPCPICFG